MTDQTAAALALGGAALVLALVLALGKRVGSPLPTPQGDPFGSAVDGTLGATFMLTLIYLAWACVRVLWDPAAVPEARAALWDSVSYLAVVALLSTGAYLVYLVVRHVDAEDARRAEQRRADAHDGRQRERGRP